MVALRAVVLVALAGGRVDVTVFPCCYPTRSSAREALEADVASKNTMDKDRLPPDSAMGKDALKGFRLDAIMTEDLEADPTIKHHASCALIPARQN